MANTQRNFIYGKMNKSLDERLIPNGEYIDALNVRLGSTEGSEVGSVENSKGNTKMTSLQYEQTGSLTGPVFLSSEARCIGAFEDGKSNRIFWFVHDPAFTVGNTGKLDLIVSFNPTTQNLTYHVISIDDGFNSNTTLNFNPKHLIIGVDLVDDLLFFTDNLNPPRFINITQNYTNPLFNIDQVSAEELMVIKKPPIKAPSLTLKAQTNNQDDYLEQRFICFAYRYQYGNGEFSATSQWSDPAFDPNIYNYSFATNMNEGMINTITGVDVLFNSGGPLVKAIQILYKESTDTVIKVVDKLSKNLLGYADNEQYSFAFDNSKIFTVLPSTELLRLYDNVPIKALGQTIMGNRLVYGNYIEGYDLKDIFNNPVQLEYQANLIETLISSVTLTTTTESGVYTFGSSQTITNSVGVVDLSTINVLTQLLEGTSLNIDFTFEHSKYDPTTGEPTTETENTDIQFVYSLPQDFTSIYEMVESTSFQNAIGTVTNIKPVYDSTNPSSCAGFTLTDTVNCRIPTTQTVAAGSVAKVESGITAAGQPIAIVGNTPSSSSIKLQMPAMRYVSDPAVPSGGFYEYYKIISITSVFSTVSNPKSLHSNRGYEIGVVYMDEFLRSSTALVSSNNTIQVPCANSTRQNAIQVTIPWAQRAPYWAKYYKFVIKPSQSTYETIYSETFFKDPRSSSYYFLLEGENAAKVEAGQRLIVKRDSRGGVEQCIEGVIIDKKVQSENFLKIRNPFDTRSPEPDPPDDDYYTNVPAGAYMQMVPNGFNVTSSETVGGNRVAHPAITTSFPIRDKSAGFPVGRALVSVKNLDPAATSTNQYIDYSIPVNSVITIRIFQNRQGDALGGISGCRTRLNTYTSPDLISSTNYTDFQSWFEGDNIGELIEENSVSDNVNTDRLTYNVYVPGTPIDGTATGLNVSVPPDNIDRDVQNPFIAVGTSTNTYQFFNANDGSKWLLATGAVSCKGGLVIGGHASNCEMEITVERANSGGVIVFETLPSNALPDIWYENNLQFNVSANGQHEGTQSNQNVQTQISAVVDTGFFNCYAFGNGVESYTIRDSIKGEALAQGNRVTTTSAQEYKEAHRFADLTYSGLYNDESNVNRLNEFNLGLLNFKPLEDSFGSIQKLFARQTDILTLQEDKISYVLAGKDLLTDAAGTGSLTSVPTVLGQQIARLEEFGISRNPESFAVFGADKFFADEQRGAIIQLKGGAYNNESLTVISEFGMRGWFRDLFHDNFDAQKLGGFDPYMNEYVLSANSITLPFVGNCDLCGSSRNITIPVGEQISYCVNVTQETGTVNIEYILPSGGNTNVISEANTPNVLAGLVELITETNSAAASGNDIGTEDASINNDYTITALYNGTSTSVTTKASGILSVPKDSVYAEDMTILVSSNSTTADTIEVVVGCAVPDQITIVQVGIGSNADRGKFIHNEYRWQDGLFTSPLHQEPMEFASGLNNPLVSQYLSLTGGQGAGVIPDDAAVVSIISNKIAFDNYDFNPNTNNFRFLRSGTFYGNINADIIALLAASTTATPVRNNSPEFFASFTMPSGNTEDYLYLIYDYRNSTEVQLCYSDVSLTDVCCVGCNIVATPAPTPAPTGGISCNSYTLTSTSTCTFYVISGNNPTVDGTYSYTSCEGNFESGDLPNGTFLDFRAQAGTLSITNIDINTEKLNSDGSTTFSWLGCNGSNLIMSVDSNDPRVVCSQNIPIIIENGLGSVTPGASCNDYYYRASQCNTRNTVFLSADLSLGRLEVGDKVYYDEVNLTGANVSVRKCATIFAIDATNGNDGVIIGQASGCNDNVNCPQDNDYVWMFGQKGRDISTGICSVDFSDFPAYSTKEAITSIMAEGALFFSDPSRQNPFNGRNKYYGYRKPINQGSGLPYAPAEQGSPEGWIQIDNEGRAISFSTC